MAAPDYLRQPEQPKDFIILFEGAEAFRFFQQLQTYWEYGFSGIPGLNHNAVISRIQLFKDTRDDQQWLLQCIEAIHSGVLQAFYDKQAEDNDKKPGDKKIALTAQQKRAITERKLRRC